MLFCLPILLGVLSLISPVRVHNDRSLVRASALPIAINGSIEKDGAYKSIKFTHATSLIWVRLKVGSGLERPVFIQVHSDSQIESWSVPHLSPDGQELRSEYRTLCLTGSTAEMDIFTESLSPIPFELRITDVSQHLLAMSDPVLDDQIQTLDRRVYFFSIPANEKAVVVKLTSSDERCAIVSIRPQNCSQLSFNQDELTSGDTVYASQTMTSQATLTLFRQNGTQDFTIIIYVPSTHSKCEIWSTKSQESGKPEPVLISESNSKSISITIDSFHSKSYYAILYLPLLCLGCALGIVVVFVCPPLAGYMEYPAKPIYKRRKLAPKTNVDSPDAIKGSFLTSLISIAIMYALPALQLLYSNQLLYLYTGNEDLCYFNFRCIRPVGYLIAFNNIYSNIGYVIFGSCFLLIVRYHSRRFTWRYREVFYSLGVALVLEGVLSAGYHVCPAPQNFQFDTTFMYIIAALCIYHLYHVRNPQLPGRPHLFYLMIACIVLYVVLGLLSSNKIFLIVLTVVYALSALALGAALTRKLYLKNSVRISGHNYVGKTLTGIHVVINLALIAFSSFTLATRHQGFASALLYMFITNMFYFFIYYLVVKLFHHERLVAGSVLCIVLALGAWAASLYFYQGKRITEWNLSPSASKAINKDCAFLDFFDYHDIWHMLSGFSIFVSFILLLTLDVSTADLGAGNRRQTVATQRHRSRANRNIPTRANAETQEPTDPQPQELQLQVGNLQERDASTRQDDASSLQENANSLQQNASSLQRPRNASYNAATRNLSGQGNSAFNSVPEPSRESNGRNGYVVSESDLDV